MNISTNTCKEMQGAIISSVSVLFAKKKRSQRAVAAPYPRMHHGRVLELRLVYVPPTIRWVFIVQFEPRPPLRKKVKMVLNLSQYWAQRYKTTEWNTNYLLSTDHVNCGIATTVCIISVIAPAGTQQTCPSPIDDHWCPCEITAIPLPK